jgi:ABC-2 type transport system ATP-binding protein
VSYPQRAAHTETLAALPPGLDATDLSLSEDGLTLICSFEQASGQMPPITQLLRQLEQAGCSVRDLHTQQSSLEEIFVQLVSTAK